MHLSMKYARQCVCLCKQISAHEFVGVYVCLNEGMCVYALILCVKP